MKGCSKYGVLFAAIVAIIALSGARSSARDDRFEKHVFVQAFYPLDEPRFHCIDIPGHKDRVNIERALTVHTCKEGIWHQDEIFDFGAVSEGQLKMPQYGLCVSASGLDNGSRLTLKQCDESQLQDWEYSDFRLKLRSHPDKCITIGSEPSELTPGGRRLPSRHAARSLELASCSKEIFQRQLW